MSTGKGLIAFLLPLTFVWSWAACSLLCGEITARQEKQSILLAQQKAVSCLVGFDIDSCPYTANAAVIEARQTVAAPILAIVNIADLPSQTFSFIPTSVYPADRNQNSPPRSSNDPPLFLKYRTFRI